MSYYIYIKIKFKQNKASREALRSFNWTFLIITAFVYQGGIIQNSFSVLSCQNYNGSGGSDLFMTENPSVRCWQGTHKIWAFFFAVPCLLAFGIILPGILLGVLIKNRKKLQDRSFISKYLFIYASYKPTAYYWEFVILFRKSLIFLLFCIFYAKSLQVLMNFS